jgi:hypothetical protein
MKAMSIHELYGVETDDMDWPVDLTGAEKQSVMAALEFYLGKLNYSISFCTVVEGVKAYTCVFRDRPLLDWQYAVVDRALREMGIDPAYKLPTNFVSTVKKENCVSCGKILSLADIACGSCGNCQHVIWSEETISVEIALLWPGNGGDSGQWNTDIYEVSEKRVEEEMARQDSYRGAIEVLMEEDDWLKDRNPVLWTIYNEGC